MAECDRSLLKEKLSAHEVYRQHSGKDGDCSWMARLKKSGIECFHLLEDSLTGCFVCNGPDFFFRHVSNIEIRLGI